jgi:hypothetical protein|tara:strand:- start:8121 stop:10196 length:2076 start_codon:yes stop_codon:yes gene_type:complete
MATAYKRVARDTANTQIDWNEVGNNLTNVLKEENRVREETRTAIDSASREYTARLNDVPQGGNSDLNTFAIDGANKLTEQKLIMTGLLKSGQMSVKQYTLMNQNLVDGTDQAFSLLENYNAEWETKMAMNNSGLPPGEQASSTQNWLMETVEGFGNFGKGAGQSSMVINPLTGIVSMAKMIPADPSNPNGPLIPDPDNIESVQVLENRIKQKITKFDVMAASEEYNEMVGEQKVVMQNLGSTYKKGIFKTISDVRSKSGGKWEGMSAADKQAQLDSVNAARKAAGEKPITLADFTSITLFQESQNNYIQSQLEGNTLAGSSVLLDFKNTNPATGEEYYEAMNTPANIAKAKTDPNMILFENKAGRIVPLLTDEQKRVSEEVLRAQIDIGVDYTEEVEVKEVFKTPKDKQYAPADVRRQDKDDKAKENVQRTWNSIKGQSAAERVASFESLIGTQAAKNAGLVGVNPSSDGLSISFEYVDPKKNRTIEFTEDISDLDWAIIGNEIVELDDPQKALEAGNFKKDKDGNSLALNLDFTGVGANRQGNDSRFDNEISSFIKEGFPKVKTLTGTEPFLDQSDTKVAQVLNDRYSEYGLKAEATGVGTTDNTLVTIDGWKGNAEYPAEFNLDSDINLNSSALEEEQRFEKWLTYVLKQTKQVDKLAQNEKFTGGKGDYGPCVGGKKENLKTKLKVPC